MINLEMSGMKGASDLAAQPWRCVVFWKTGEEGWVQRGKGGGGGLLLCHVDPDGAI